MLRLKTRAQFQAVLTGSVMARTEHFALHSCPSNKPPVDNNGQVHLFDKSGMWLGAMVPKRWAKRAVTRNAIKRQIYALSDDFDFPPPDRALVVRLRAGFERSRFISAASDALKVAVRTELQQLFAKAQSADFRPTTTPSARSGAP